MRERLRSYAVACLVAGVLILALCAYDLVTYTGGRPTHLMPTWLPHYEAVTPSPGAP